MFFTVHFLLDAVEERGGEFEISYVFGWMLGTALIFQLLTFSNTCFFFFMGKAVEKACDYGWKTAVRHIQ